MTATDRPFTAALDIGKMIEGLRTLERLAASPEHIVPGHDPRVMTRCHVRGSRRARRRDAEAGLGALMGCRAADQEGERGAEGSARGADREGATQMKINRGREKAVRSERRSETFTGTVWADRVLSDPAGAVGIGSVFFEPGARTHWHRHTAGQVLVVTHGQGRVRSRDGSGGVIAAGDVVHIAPGEEHWHGAGADSYMLHLAISLGKSEWLRAVTDEEYRQGFE